MRSANPNFPWCGIGVQSTALVRKQQRRAGRRGQSVAYVLAAMQRGAVLHLRFQSGRALWSLSSGAFVAPETAAVVVARSEVVDDGDSLFVGMSQTWRYVEQGR